MRGILLVSDGRRGGVEDERWCTVRVGVCVCGELEFAVAVASSGSEWKWV
jgi:hypothetical protein